ncbi:GGDEF domain-containing protein [Paucibacter sp. O1-1]|nr:GGDEF domain-containing protein [Paucibacter sp. O1-1]MDA3831239.1 GGDEF domain-containing protein [Paucibacter sp. O1-1]
MLEPDPSSAFEAINSVVIAEFDSSGRLVHGNAGLHRITTGEPTSLWQVITHPHVESILASTPDPSGVMYSGLLTAQGADGSMLTLTGAIYRRGDRIRLLAGYDMEEFEALAASLLALNEDLNHAYRELARSKQAVEAREAEILVLSLTDALTGVGNRRMLDEVLAREVERSRRTGDVLSLTILDIDHFKRVNDRWGHDTGDRVLRETGAVLLHTMRLADIATRMGGEEFVLVLPGTDLDEALICAERLRGAMATHDFGLAAPVTASFGVAALTPGESGPALLARADSGLYRAKQEGRNRVMAAAEANA